MCRLTYFNPRAPCGARPLSSLLLLHGLNFNPRAPCGARLRELNELRRTVIHFNPRAPCGARRRLPIQVIMDVKFQPTRPLRGATVAKHTNNLDEKISTHAPLAGRDFAVSTFVLTLLYFNPRAPCGARLVNDFDVDSDTLFQPTRPLRGATSLSTSMTKLSTFQPTRPLRGATIRIDLLNLFCRISTHAPLAGRD